MFISAGEHEHEKLTLRRWQSLYSIVFVSQAEHHYNLLMVQNTTIWILKTLWSFLWQQYLNNQCCMINIMFCLCFLCFFYYEHLTEVLPCLAFILIMDDELNNGDVPAVTGPAVNCRARKMWVHDTIHRRQKYVEYHPVFRDKERRWHHQHLSEEQRDFQLRAVRWRRALSHMLQQTLSSLGTLRKKDTGAQKMKTGPTYANYYIYNWSQH